jgi:EAL domain-containing protein (putative c-di-GMP-specific phosphodiesterase class I)
MTSAARACTSSRGRHWGMGHRVVAGDDDSRLLAQRRPSGQRWPGSPGDRVVLELTEHELVEDYDRLNAAVDRFRRLGFRLAVDAWCAGFGHILKVSPDVIKLDRTITQSIDVHHAHQDMAASLVALARGVGASVVAEGVETEAEADALLAVGVDNGQGYLFGHPAKQPW